MLDNTGERIILDGSWDMVSTMEHLHRYNSIKDIVKGKRVLDAACGSGYGSYILSQYAESVLGIDLSKDAIEYANIKYKNKNLKFLNMSVTEIDKIEDKIDIIISFETIEHISKEMQELFIKKAKYKLGMDGILIISTPNDVLLRDITHGNYANEYHIAEFLTEKEYFEFLSKEYRYIEMYYQTVMESSIILSKDNNHNLGNIFSMSNDNCDGRYYIAICSNNENKNILSLQSIMAPEFKEYFDTKFLKKESVIYADCGDGFDGINYCKAQYFLKADKQFICRFDISEIKNIKMLRFDPCESFCFCKVDEIKSNVKDINIYPLNGKLIEDEYVFFNTIDPIYMINSDDFENIDWLEIHGKIDIIPNDIAISKLESEYNLIKEVNEQVSAELKKSIDENDKLKKSIIEYEEANENIRKNFKFKEEKNAEVQSCLKKEIEELTSKYIESESYLQNIEIENKLIQEELKKELEIWKLKFNTIENAFFWKITYPPRLLLDLIKKNIVVNNFRKIFLSIKYYGIKETLKKIKKYLKKMNNISTIKLTYELNDQISFQNMCKDINQMTDGKIYLEDILKKYDLFYKNKVLLVSHALDLTGGPMALFSFAKTLKSIGKYPLIVCETDGNLRKVIEEADIPVIINKDLYNAIFINKYVKLFDFVVANTIVTYPIVNILMNTDTELIWWIHEANISYNNQILERMPVEISSNIRVYCGGDYAQKILKNYRPSYESKILLYSTEDIDEKNIEEMIIENKQNKFVFALIGMQENRKGQDILVDAILNLPNYYIEEALFIFVGKRHEPEIYKKIEMICSKFPENIMNIEELYPNDLKKLYKSIDCLICSSKDDPMPIVATEAMAMGKIIICSENTGTAALLREMEAGIIYKNNDSDELLNSIIYVLKNKNSLNRIKSNARQTYERFFLENIFRKNIEEIISQIDGNYLNQNMNDILNLLKTYPTNSVNIINEDIIREYDNDVDGKKILLISHELSLTGAPVALHYLAKFLRDEGHCPIILSPFSGKMQYEISKDNIPVVIFEEIYESDFLKDIANKFDLIVLNTVVAYRAVYMLENLDVQVMWWIHDSEASYKIGGFGECLPPNIGNNINVYCAGPYAKDKLQKYYKTYKAHEFLYYVPDFSKDNDFFEHIKLKTNDDKIIFTIIGMQDERKGHDILVKAINSLDIEIVKKSKFIFIGKKYSEEIWRAIKDVSLKYPENIMYIESFNRDEIFSIYNQSDCIICSSKDDPMPIFVTEGMLMSKLIICSENTGSASLIESWKCGFVYRNNDYRELAEKITYVVNNIAKLEDIKVNARRCYDENFSEEVFKDKTRKILIDMIPSYKNNTHGISVVIPTYNAGDKFGDILDSLLSQEEVKNVEIVVIDSGSTDQTIDIVKSRKVKLIEIPQSEFSHSYARNLGAKNSNGDILIFMTQDSKPSSKYWMINILKHLKNRNVVAVSCVEKCPQETTLFHCVASWYHQVSLGIIDKDRETSKEDCLTEYDWRRNAALNDVACAIKKNIFEKFLYRFNYAEDLDLGIRLLKSGYKIKLLSSEYVIHGHNRNEGYYIKRGLVDALSLEKILGSNDIKESEIDVASKVIVAYNVFALVKKNIFNYIKEEKNYSFKFIFKKIDEIIKMIMDTDEIDEKFYVKDIIIEDDIVGNVIQILMPYANKKEPNRYDLVYSVKYYYNEILLKYLEKNNIIGDEYVVNDIIDCIMKQLATNVGVELSRLNTDKDSLNELLDGLKKGV